MRSRHIMHSGRRPTLINPDLPPQSMKTSVSLQAFSTHRDSIVSLSREQSQNGSLINDNDIFLQDR